MRVVVESTRWISSAPEARRRRCSSTQASGWAWLRPAVFASALWTDPERSAHRKDYANIGAGGELRFSVLHWYDMTLSAGYAVGLREGKRSGSEWMVSLKIL